MSRRSFSFGALGIGDVWRLVEVTESSGIPRPRPDQQSQWQGSCHKSSQGHGLFRSAEFQLSNFAAAMKDLTALLKVQPNNSNLDLFFVETVSAMCQNHQNFKNGWLSCIFIRYIRCHFRCHKHRVPSTPALDARSQVKPGPWLSSFARQGRRDPQGMGSTSR